LFVQPKRGGSGDCHVASHPGCDQDAAEEAVCQGQATGSYQWRYATTAAPTAWTLLDPTMAANIPLNGLVPGTQYIVQVRAVGSQGPSDWSDAATLMVV
jgi:hypothetical protein